MDISSNFGVSSYSSLTQSSEVQSSRPPPPPRPEPVEGELSGYLSEADNAEEAKSFMQDFMSMSLSGEFDAEALAASAPESLIAYAEEQGVDLEEMMESANEHFEEMGSNRPESGNRPPPPPPPEDGESSSTFSFDDLSQAYASVSEYGNNETDLMDSLLSSLSIKTTA